MLHHRDYELSPGGIYEPRRRVLRPKQLNPGVVAGGASPPVALNAPATLAPLDNPALPAWADRFSPNFTGSAPGGSEPQISRCALQAVRGDVIPIVGYQFDGSTGATIFGQSTNVDAALNSATNVELNGNNLAVQVPNSLPASALYIVWPTNAVGVGYGNPVLVNQTIADWLQCSSNLGSRNPNWQPGVSGDTVTVTGRNLLGPGGNCAVYIQPASGGGSYVTPTAVNSERVTFTMPGGLAPTGTSTTSLTIGTGDTPTITTQAGLGYAVNQDIILFPAGFGPYLGSQNHFMRGIVKSYSGTSLVVTVTETASSGTYAAWSISPGYQVWLHNGHGGPNYGWSLCPHLLIYTTLNALGNDYAGATYTMPAPTGGDDLANFNTARAALANVGGTINLLNGNYQLSATFDLTAIGGGANAYIKGTGNALCSIRALPGFSDTHLINSDQKENKFSDLTLDFDTNSPTFTSGQCMIGGVEYKNVVMLAATQANGVATLIASTVYQLKMTGCTVRGQGIAMGVAGPQLIDNNTFVQYNAAETPYYFQGSTDYITYTNNACSDFDNSAPATRGCGRDFFGDVGKGTQCHYFAGNSSPSRYALAGKGEHYCYDGGAGDGQQAVSSAATSGGITTLTCTAMAGDWTGYFAVITAGKGLSQYGRIISCNVGAKTLTLDRALRLLPDATSIVSIVGIATKFVFRDNTGTTVANGNGVGFAGFAGSTDGNVHDNTWNGVNVGIYNYSVQPGTYGQPAFFNYFANNGGSSVQTAGLQPWDLVATLHADTASYLGEVYKNNNFTLNGATAYAGLNLSQYTGTQSDLLIFQNCTFTNTPTGIGRNVSLDASQPTPNANIVVYGSAFTLGTATFSGSHGKSTARYTLAESGNTYTGFQA